MTPGAPGERRPLIWCKAVILVTTHLAKAKVTGAHGDRRAGTWDLRVGDPAVGPGQGPRRSSSGCAALLQTPRRAGRSPPTGRREPGAGRERSAGPTGRTRLPLALARGAPRRGGAGRTRRPECQPGRRVRKRPNPHLKDQGSTWKSPSSRLLLCVFWLLDKYQFSV